MKLVAEKTTRIINMVDASFLGEGVDLPQRRRPGFREADSFSRSECVTTEAK
ncbi:hypothetical protein [Caenimonas sedimenti]|uniref:hypothetical protein n=1 Tax=Caenimonas sedimenti TaxID=2596921 RepID=UPI0016470C22|nr:hypothetical protein [Caenimonas sedimenti]